jgi:hypothetical protein
MGVNLLMMVMTRSLCGVGGYLRSNDWLKAVSISHKTVLVGLLSLFILSRGFQNNSDTLVGLSAKCVRIILKPACLSTLSMN